MSVTKNTIHKLQIMLLFEETLKQCPLPSVFHLCYLCQLLKVKKTTAVEQKRKTLCTLHTHTHAHTHAIKTHFEIKNQLFKCSFDFSPYWDCNLWHGVLKEHMLWKWKDLGLISGLATTTVIVWVSISSPEKWK